MDEVDSIGSARTENSGGGGDSEVQRTMLELLNQLDGFEASNKIKVRCVAPRCTCSRVQLDVCGQDLPALFAQQVSAPLVLALLWPCPS